MFLGKLSGPVLTLNCTPSINYYNPHAISSYPKVRIEKQAVTKLYKAFNRPLVLSTLTFLYNLDRIKTKLTDSKLHYDLDKTTYNELMSIKRQVQHEFELFLAEKPHKLPQVISLDKLNQFSSFFRSITFNSSRDLAAQVFKKSIPSFPKAIQRRLFLLSDQEEFLQDAIISWLNFNKKEKTEDNIFKMIEPKDALKFFKNAIKYHMHEKFGWQQTGYGGYMTGDWLATVGSLGSNRNVTVKYLDYVDYNPQKEISFSSNMAKDRLVPSLNPFFDNRQQVKVSFAARDTNDKDYQGLKQTYRERFGRIKTRPWNQHVSDIHKQIFNKTNLTVNKLQQLLVSIPVEEKQAIDSYFNHVLKPGHESLIVWGRRSGHNFGAHKELDSDDTVFLHLINQLGAKYPNKDIFFFGDAINGLSKIENPKFKPFVSFWRKPLLQSRLSQLYLIKKFQDVNAIQLGMRSGNLEGHAYLGLKTIYFDERDSKKVESSKRLEPLVGTGARDRYLYLDDLESFEQRNQGVFPHYKRFVSRSTYGRTPDKINELDDALDHLEQFNTVIKDSRLKYSINVKMLSQFIDIFSDQKFSRLSLNEKVIALTQFHQQSNILKEDKVLGSKRLKKTKVDEIRRAYKYCKPEPITFDSSRVYFRLFKQMYLSSKKLVKNDLKG